MSTVEIFDTPLLVPAVFLFGLLVGSFLNVVILRLPKMMEHEWRCQCQELLDELEGGDDTKKVTPKATDPKPPGLIHPRSKCPNCGHQIRAWENIPVLSWVLLRGKCSECKARISIRYPLVELMTGIAFATVAMQLGPTVLMLAGLVLTALLIAMAGIDYDYQLLPDSLTMSLLWIGLVLSVPGFLPSIFSTLTHFELRTVSDAVLPVTPAESIMGATLGYVSLWLVFQGFKLLTKKEGMGYGDFKLLAALGAWMGWKAILPIVLVSAGVGAIIGVLMFALQITKWAKPIPFGPFLAAAGWIMFLWGDVIGGGIRAIYSV